jgi:hypothetical protein
MIPWREASHAGAQFADYSGAFVPTDGRQRPLAQAFHDGEVGVAQARAPDFHKHLARAGWIQFNLFDTERLRFGERRRQALFVHDSGSHSHGVCSP